MLETNILDLLPQRYPFLMIDRIIELKSDSIITLKNVTHNEPHFEGHFPDNPIMPGALILEALMQTSILLAKYDIEIDSRAIMYVTTMDKIRFQKPVLPGDQMHLKVSRVGDMGSTIRFAGAAWVGKYIVAQASWTSMLVSPGL